MPKSKRNKQISLTKTRKKGLELKQNLVEEGGEECESVLALVYKFTWYKYQGIYIPPHYEGSKFQTEVRFFFGKNKVMSLALGRTPEAEYSTNLHYMSNHIKGQCGLLFTNKSREEVQKWFDTYSDLDFARAGNIATETVSLKEGPLMHFSHAIEPHLRQLGMPTALQKGVVILVKDYEVCKNGDILNPEQTKILKLLGNQMAEFRITIQCMWSKDGTFEDFQKTCSPGDKLQINMMDLDTELSYSEKELQGENSTDDETSS